MPADPDGVCNKNMNGGDHLYIAQQHTTGAFKVGRSSDPERRLAELQTGSPYLLRMILVVEGQGEREKRVHRALQGYHAQGVQKGEWFIEPGLSSLPTDLYERLDLDMVNTWWETPAGPLHPPGPPPRRAAERPDPKG